MPGRNEKNLKPNPERSPEELRNMAIKGGIASGEARRKKRLMSDIYRDFLIEEFDIVLNERELKLTGEKLLNSVIKDVLAKGGAPSVSLMKEIREATEGGKLALTGADGGPIEVSEMTGDERKARIAELLARRADI